MIMEISQNDKQREKRIKKKNRKEYTRTVDNLKGMGLHS